VAGLAAIVGIVRPDIMDRFMTTVNSIDVVFLK
jgi:hypothetical protein